MTSPIGYSLDQATPIDTSRVVQAGITYFLAGWPDGAERLVVQGETTGFQGTEFAAGVLAPLSTENAAELRRRLPWLTPVPLGVRTSFGFGDRIGLATPGHIQAMRSAAAVDQIAPIFAQQSVRENARIGRTPQEVIDAALWGIFGSGWRAPWGADADHVKTEADLPPFVAAGYTFYTIDPSDHVDNAAQTDSLDQLRQKAHGLPWPRLQTTLEQLRDSYCATSFDLEGVTLVFDEERLLRALVKYGSALAHTLALAEALQRLFGQRPFDLEMSVDETDTPTSPHEHFFIARELLRLDVPVMSLAPRFVGKFQKGVDYMGRLEVFSAELAQHAAIMHHFDRYKLSIHTGSDKFSIYKTIYDHTAGRVHVKTAGTSYLEALRVLATETPALMRQILSLAHARFMQDRQSYYLDCRPEQVPTSDQLDAGELPALLDDFDARQLLHVTFGSALDQFGPQIQQALRQHAPTYASMLAQHFSRHLRPFL